MQGIAATVRAIAVHQCSSGGGINSLISNTDIAFAVKNRSKKGNGEDVPQKAVVEPNVLTMAEVAARLRCSKAHVCNTINGKVKGVTPLPAITLGRRKLIRRESFERWLSQNDPGNAMMEPSHRIDAVNA
jgi:hypothetical protein